MSVAEVRSAYGARAKEYTDVLGSVEALAQQDRETISEWARSIDGRIIDVGSGPGHWAKLLHDLGVAVEGVDIAHEFVESARQRFPEVPFHVGLISELPSETSYLSGLLSWYSIIHTAPEEVSGVLNEFARCLKPGGSLLLGFFDGDRVEPFDHVVVTAYYWPVPEMCRALEAAGFEILQVQTRTDPGSRPHAAIIAELRG